MNKKILLLLLVFLCNSVNALLTVDVESIDNSIYLDEQAKFKLTINSDKTKVVQVYSPDIEWNLELEPFITTIAAKSDVEVELKLIPSVWASPGAKIVVVYAEAPNTNEKIELQLPINVKSFDDVKKDYNPSVELSVAFPDKIDPRETIPVDIYLRNRNRLDIKALELSLKSDLFEEYKVMPLGPLAERREKLFFDIAPLTKPKQGQIDIMLIVGNKTINRERTDFEVIPYSTFVKKEEVVDELFKKRTIFTITNVGNVHKIDNFRVTTTFLKRMFTKSEPNPTNVNLKQGYIEWNLALEPMEEYELEVVINYRPIIYILLIAVVVSMIYFIYRSPITIKKEAIITGATEDSISEMKVLLHVRNRSQDLIEEVEITDLIPSIANLVKDSHIGSIAPSKVIKHHKRGTIIKWNLDAIEPFEERIISYRLKSKIAIVGGFTLPPAKVKFETYKGKERVIRSNRSSVSMGL